MKYLIHVEKAWDDVVWRDLLEFVKTNKCHLFLMPPQYHYQKAVLGYEGTEQDLIEILKHKYNKLKSLQEKYNFKIGMHLHFCLNPKELSEQKKEKIFFNSYKFLKEIIGDINGITFGWFKYDSYLEELCKKNNLKILHSGISFHDYDLPITKFKLFEVWIRDKLRRLFR